MQGLSGKIFGFVENFTEVVFPLPTLLESGLGGSERDLEI